MKPYTAQMLIRRSRRGFFDFLKPGVKVRPTDPFTLEALEDGVKVKMYMAGSWIYTAAIEYATTSSPEYTTYSVKNGSSLTSGVVVSLNAGEKVSFIGNAPDGLGGSNPAQYSAFAMSGRVAVHGNLYTLVLKDAYIGSGYSGMLQPQEVSLPPNAFPFLFHNCTGLTSAPALPATSLAANCYYGMFSGCTSLAEAPALPATSLAANCYNGMFSGCTSLAEAPALPATSLAANCYYGMFSGCTSLAEAPALPATSLAANCYYGMFSGCTSLAAAPAFSHTSITGTYVFREMFSGCTSLAEAPLLPDVPVQFGCYMRMFNGCRLLQLPEGFSLPATELAQYCYNGMFSGCTSLAEAPALPATSLAANCYNGMFSGCTSLAAIPALPATELAANCYNGMFSGCSGIAAEAAAVLPASELVSGCYREMFRYAGRLKSMDVSFTKWKTSDGCTTNWVEGLLSSGAFRKPSALETVRGNSGIPEGWAVNTK